MWLQRRETMVVVFAFIVSLLVYVAGALDSPLLNSDRRAEVAHLSRHASAGKLDERREVKLAEIYWTRYPDVAQDSNFGRSGKLGSWGAREHFKRHGAREGRIWPVQP